MTDELAPSVPASDAAPAANAEAQPAAPSPAPEKVDNVQKRIDRLTWEKNEYRRQLDELRAKPEAKTEPVAPVKPPTIEDSNFDEAKHQEALREYYRAEARREARDEIKKVRDEESARERASTWEKRQADFVKANPDYRELVLDNPTLPITKEMAQVIQESDMGPQVALYLAKNEEKAAAIAQLNPFLQARELGRIEAQLEAAKSPPPAPPKPSAAPPPVPKIQATDDEVSEKDPSKMSDSEFAKWRKRQIAQRR